MSKEDVTAEVSGLQLSNNTFSASPPGSLRVAEECVMPQKGVIEPRRGQERAYTLPSAAELALAMVEFQGSLLLSWAADKSSLTYGLGVAANPSVNYSGGPWNPVDDNGSSQAYGRMKFGQAAGFLHFCTTSGPKTLETTAGPPRVSGLLQMPDPIVRMSSASNLGANGVGLAYGSSRAYRTLLRKPTATGVSLLSPPSGRRVVTNRIVAPVGAMVRTGGTTVTVTLPIDPSTNPGLAIGDSFTLTPGEANFPAGAYTVASVTNNVFTYASAGANVANTVAEDFDTGPRPVAVFIALSADASTATPARVYRSYDTSSTTVQPSDELFLVDELYLSAGNVTAGVVAYLDIIPASVISNPLYTNPQTGQGEAQANDRAPVYRDVAVWQERAWYLNTTYQALMNLQMLGVGGPNGVQDGDTITINVDATDYVFTFKNTPGAANDVQITSTGTPSQNITATAQKFVEIIFQAFRTSFGANVPLCAFYESGQNEAPGKLLLQRLDFGANFTVKASRPASWVPALAAATATSSTIERIPNGLAYAKVGEPEAVPLLNRTTVGSRNYAGLRTLPIEQALTVFKEGDGIYAVTGQYPFTVQQISVANLIAPDAACVFADNVWAYTDQGVLRVTNSGGATVVSRPIETELNALRAQFPDETHDWSFMVPYETERRLLLFVPVSATGTNGLPTLRAYCWNNATQAWTGPLYVDAFSGVVSLTADKLALGKWDVDFATGRVTLERKGGGLLDLADASFSNTLLAMPNTFGAASINGVIINLLSLTGVREGDGITQSVGGVLYRTKLKQFRPDVGPNCVEVYEPVPWALGACTMYQRYAPQLEFLPVGSPTTRKTLTRLAWLFKEEQFEAFTGTTLLRTDQQQVDDEIATPSVGFGSNPFGQVPFGDPSPLLVDVNPLGSAWTNAAQFMPGFSVAEAWPKLKLQGVGLYLEPVLAPTGRGK